MTLLTERFRMAGLTCRLQSSKPRLITMSAQEIGSLVVCRQQRNEIGVAILAGIRGFRVVVAGVARSHVRHVLRAGELDLIQTFVACCALNVRSPKVIFV
jgi:hypothetical protein